MNHTPPPIHPPPIHPPHHPPPGRAEPEPPTAWLPLGESATRRLPVGAPPVWRRRSWQLGVGIGALAAVGLVAGIALASPDPSTPAAAPQAGVSAPSAPPTAPPSAGAGHRGGRFAVGPGESLLRGTVGSVAGDRVTVAAAGGGQTSVLTDAATTFVGNARSAADLTPGERITVLVKDGTAVAVRVPGVRPTG